MDRRTDGRTDRIESLSVGSNRRDKKRVNMVLKNFLVVERGELGEARCDLIRHPDCG